MSDLPTDVDGSYDPEYGIDPRWPTLLVAARVWRESLIPGTSTAVRGPTSRLLEAIESFDA